MTDKVNQASERGIALIVVLLLMAVLSGLATGFAMTGQVEVQMGTNEVYYAGARAAAEAGLNRAIVEITGTTTTNYLAGADNLVSTNPTDPVNADNGSLAFILGAGPYPVGTSGQYSYNLEILDDDNDLLYETALTPTQVAAMGEDDFDYTNINDRFILRATGNGPNGTTIKIGRIIETTVTTNPPSTNTTLANPAILVNGNFEMNGVIAVTGLSGGVHANGNLLKTGNSGTVTGSATASGTFAANPVGWTAAGATGGGRPTINVPNIQAADYMNLADYKLTTVGGVGVVQTWNGSAWATCTTAACKGTDWSYSGGTWSSGKNPAAATYYIEGNVDVGPTSGSSNKAVSVIATGDINVHGNAKLTPENVQKLQFVCNGDLDMEGTIDLDDPTTVEGQILVRGQFDAGGNMEFQGRVMVQDVAGAGNLVTDNRIHGGVVFTYNGTLGAISTTTVIPGTTTFVNNVTGWMEQ